MLKRKKLLMISAIGRKVGNPAITSWSGTNHHIYKQLAARYDIKYFNSYSLVIITGIFIALAKVIKKFLRRNAIYGNYLYSHICGFFIRLALLLGKYDLIFVTTGNGSWNLFTIKTSIPIIYLNDATFSLLNNYYKTSLNYSSSTIKYQHKTESSLIKKARILLYSSQWAANSAIRDYGAEEKKVHVIPFGINLINLPSKEKIFSAKRNQGICKLFFSGVDWHRKGGDIAVEILLSLLELGVNAELTVAGCHPPQEIMHDKIKFVGFLRKDIPEEAVKLEELYLFSNFFLLPTRADCTPMVFGEANSYGLPTISSDTGGVGSLVITGVTGVLLAQTATPNDYAKEIKALWENKEKYEALKISARNYCENNFAWEKWLNRVSKIIEEEIFSSNND